MRSFNNCVLLSDGFKKEKRNADYPIESSFSDLMFNYKSKGGIGYSDYLTVGETYEEINSAPYAIAIHYSIVRNKAVFVKHYISDTNKNQKDQAGKFLEAIKKFKKDYDLNNYIKTIGTKQLIDFYNSKHYPGLGKIKQVSMEHHIEVMSQII